MHVMLLALLADMRSQPTDDVYLNACRKAISGERHYAQWEDFETYWSCSGEWAHKRHGQIDERSGLYHQCNFGIYWTAEAFKAMYQCTSEPRYLESGERALAELSLYQQIWQPPFFTVPSGALASVIPMNGTMRGKAFLPNLYGILPFDRQRRLWVRGAWAMNASFIMMYCPESGREGAVYRHSHFGEDNTDSTWKTNHHDGTAKTRLGRVYDFRLGQRRGGIVARGSTTVRINRSGC